MLLPLSALRSPAARLKRPTADEAVLGIAAELVGVPEALRPAVDLSLGKVSVTRDRSAARRVLAGQPSGVRG